MSRPEGWEELQEAAGGAFTKTVLRSMAGLFERSSRLQLDRLLSTLQLRQYHAGAVLCSEGETAKELYVLCGGRCGIYTQESHGRLRLIDTGDQVGALVG